MRFTILSVLALVVSLTSVTAKPFRQFKPRLATDVCADVDDDLVISGTTMGKITACLCASGVTDFISSGDPTVSQAVGKYGTQSVTRALNNLISDSDNSEQCQYPDNSVGTCETGDSCAFKCLNGFVPTPEDKPATCVCPFPLVNCNGQCVIVCSSQPSYPYLKRDLEFDCDPGWKLCKILGRETMECVDVMNDLWSCGGCEIPFSEDERVGIDCTALPNVAGVSCLDGVCKVGSCARGFRLDDNETSCTPVNSTVSQYPVFVQNGRGSF